MADDRDPLAHPITAATWEQDRFSLRRALPAGVQRRADSDQAGNYSSDPLFPIRQAPYSPFVRS
jgi:hypothetical protein